MWAWAHLKNRPLVNQIVSEVIKAIDDLADYSVNTKHLFSGSNGIPIQPLVNWKNQHMAEMFKELLESRINLVFERDSYKAPPEVKK